MFSRRKVTMIPEHTDTPILVPAHLTITEMQVHHVLGLQADIVPGSISETWLRSIGTNVVATLSGCDSDQTWGSDIYDMCADSIPHVIATHENWQIVAELRLWNHVEWNRILFASESADGTPGLMMTDPASELASLIVYEVALTATVGISDIIYEFCTGQTP